MKKLALALLCLVSVAFFTSCQDPTPGTPTITVFNAQGYLQDGMVIELNQDYPISFICNSVNGKELASFAIKVGDEVYFDTLISGTSYTYDGLIGFTPDTRDTVGVVITATVTDAAGESASATLNIGVVTDTEEEELESKPFEWYRLGNNVTGLDQFGLVWSGNYQRDYYAKITPMDDVTLFIFDAKDWNETMTASQKETLFHNAIDGQHAAEYYWNINVTQANMQYNDVIGTIMPDGTLNLLRINTSTSVNQGSQGTAVTVNGDVK